MYEKLNSFTQKRFREGKTNEKSTFTPPPPLAPRHCGFLKRALLNKKGLGLVEILVMSTIGVVALSGSAEFLKVVLSSAKVSNSILTENDFKQTIAKGLAIDCNPANSNKIIKRGGDLDETDKSNNVIEFTGSLPGGIESGEVFKDSIKVIKIELRGDDYSDNNNKKSNFVVYYKKLNLGEKAGAPDSVNCTDTPTVKTTGCFHHTCQVKYNHQHAKCEGVDDCHVFSENTIKEIQEISKAEITATIKEKDCPAPTSGNPQKFIKGFKEDGSPDCKAPPSGASFPANNSCDPQEVVIGINTDGTVRCAPACSGGRTLFESIVANHPPHFMNHTLNYPVGGTAPEYTTLLGTNSRFCQCQDNEHWDGTNCVTCTGDQRFLSSEKACMSCIGGNFVSLGGGWQCDCQGSGYIKKKWFSLHL